MLENGREVRIQMEDGQAYIARVLDAPEYEGRELYPTFDCMQSKLGTLTAKEELVLRAILG